LIRKQTEADKFLGLQKKLLSKETMVIVKLMGGLGNQMFQYALGRSLSLHHNVDFKMDTSFLLDRTPRSKDIVIRDYDLSIFNIVENFATAAEVQRLKKKVLNNKRVDLLTKKILGINRTYIKEPHFHFCPEIFSQGPNIYLDGYWQTEKYFLNCKEAIRNDFTFRKPPGKNILELLNKINECNAVCVNVRRGDFLVNSYHGAISTDYYERGASIVREKISNVHFFVFSDDIEWCQQNLKLPDTTTYVTHEYAGGKFSDYLRLMIHCKHFIIPNSTFGWWSAWLNNNDDKIVIAPEKWFGSGPKDTQDIIPDDWIKI
jgi:hypothetical protein